jgi:diguanylate cyclase (GGDEF)-like protein
MVLGSEYVLRTGRVQYKREKSTGWSRNEFSGTSSIGLSWRSIANTHPATSAGPGKAGHFDLTVEVPTRSSGSGDGDEQAQILRLCALLGALRKASWKRLGPRRSHPNLCSSSIWYSGHPEDCPRRLIQADSGAGQRRRLVGQQGKGTIPLTPLKAMARSADHTPQLKDLVVFHNVARALTSELDLDAILRAIMRQMEQYFRPEQWSLLIVDEPRQELFYAVVIGHAEADLRDVRVKMGEGLAGWVAEHGEPLIIPEAEDDPRLAQPVTGRRFRIESAICMPLRSRQRTLGVIQLFNCRIDALADDTIFFLHLLCDYAAIAIENARAVERIQELTITDDCTGLFNQRQLYRMLKGEQEHAQATRNPFSLIFIDLDYFKRVNDQYGHLIGSRLLAEFGHALRSLVRGVDAVFRYGGDEFIVLLHETGREEAERKARQMHRELANRMFRVAEGLDLAIRASYGVATWPGDGEDAHELIRRADSAMYRVKGSTRDGVAVAGRG